MKKIILFLMLFVFASFVSAEWQEIYFDDLTDTPLNSGWAQNTFYTECSPFVSPLIWDSSTYWSGVGASTQRANAVTLPHNLNGSINWRVEWKVIDYTNGMTFGIIADESCSVNHNLVQFEINANDGSEYGAFRVGGGGLSTSQFFSADNKILRMEYNKDTHDISVFADGVFLDSLNIDIDNNGSYNNGFDQLKVGVYDFGGRVNSMDWINVTYEIPTPPIPLGSVNITTPTFNQFFHALSTDINFSLINSTIVSYCALYHNETGSYTLYDNRTTSINLSTETYTNIFNDDVLAWWRFEDMNNYSVVIDYSDNNNTATINDLYNYSLSKQSNETGNYSADLDGFNDDLIVANTGNKFSFVNGSVDRPFSISVWVNMEDASKFQIVTKAVSSSTKEFLFGTTSTDEIRFQLWSELNSAISILAKTSSYTSHEDSWHHYVAVYDGSESASGLKIYVDGIDSIAVQSTAGSYQNLGSSVAPLRIGGYFDTSTQYAEGRIDEVIIFNEALTDNKVLDLYNNGLNISLNITINSTIINGTLVLNQTNTIDYVFESDESNNISFYLSCDLNDVLTNSSLWELSYNSDITNPIISLIYPSQNEHINDTFLVINFSTNEYSNCDLNNSFFNLQSSNGLIHFWNETLLDNGDYNINISCIDLSSNEDSIILNFTKDTTLPAMIWYTPYDDDTYITGINETFTTNVLIFDSNLYMIEAILYDNNQFIVANWSITGITPPFYSLQENYVPDSYGIWELQVSGWDSHTTKKLDFEKDYKHKVDNKKIVFDMINKKKKFHKTNVTIDYKGKYSVNKIDLIEDKDRFKFKYDFDLKQDKNKKVKHTFRVECNNLKYVSDSPYKAHFLCLDSENWIDFESDEVLDYSVFECGIDCFDVEIDMNGNEIIEFSSIGTLNKNVETHSFTVEDVVTQKPFDFFINFESLSGVLLLFIFAFLFISLYLIGFIFKNFGFISMAFFIGIILGLAFYTFHIFVTILFMLLNFFIFYSYSKSQ